MDVERTTKDSVDQVVASRPPPERGLQRIGLCALAASLVAGTLGVGLWRRNPPYDPLEFDSARWRAAPEAGSKDAVRRLMVDDLIQDGRLVGKSLESTIEILGPPLRESLDGRAKTWHAGVHRGLFGGPAYLVVHFDPAGRISTQEIQYPSSDARFPSSR